MESESGRYKNFSILNNLPDLIFVLDSEFNILFINKTMEDRLEVDAAGIIGKKCYEVIHNTKKPLENCPAKEFFATKELRDIKTHLPIFDGYFWITVSPMYDENKQFMGLLHIARDITDLKKVEEDLKREKFEKELILESSPSHISFIDRDFNVVWANRAYIINSGLSEEEVFSKKCYEIWHKRSSPCLLCPVQDAIKTKKMSSGDVQDYKGRWWFIRANPVFDSKGNVLGSVENTINITYQKFLEKKLKKSEDRFEKLINSASVGFLLYKNNKWIYANPYACKITGYSLNELRTMNFWDFVTSEHKNFVKELGQKRQKGYVSLISSYETKIITKNGEEKWVYVSAIPIDFRDGKAILVTCIDITERKKLESKLKEILKDFEDISRSIPDSIIWKIDLDKKTKELKDVFVSPNLEILWGIPKNIFYKKDLWENYILKEDIHNLKEFLEKIINNPQKSYGIEHKLITLDKKVLWVYSRACVRLLDNKLRIVGYTGNITKRKEMEKRILNSEKEFRTIFESVSDGVVILKDFKVIRCNTNFLKIIGFRKEEVLEKYLWEFFCVDKDKEEELKLKIMNIASTFLKEGESYSFEYSFRKQEEIYYVEITLTTYNIGEDEYILTMIRDITARKRTEERMRYLSMHDPLTGLYNRSFFEAEMNRLNLSRAFPVTILVADIDGLKLINDTMGHKKGDELIKKCAYILKNSLRASDILARIGGDEFAVLLPYSDKETAEKVKGRILKEIEKYNNNFPELPVHLSIGFATSERKDFSLEVLYKEADDIMYWNKVYQGRKLKQYMLKSFINSLWTRDYIKDGHTKRIILWCKRLASMVGLSKYEIKRLILLAFFHDLGKVAIPDDILFKKGKLDFEEWEIVKKHSEIGYKIAGNMPKISDIRSLILKHHERWNGDGYPLGIKGVDIPMECRIFSICEAFDVMTRNTPYRRALEVKYAKSEILKNKGLQFDPYLTQKFLEMKPEELINESIS